MSTTVQARTVLVIGNPNVGKTTLINALAGTHLKVGNWSGVTVEKREARFDLQGVSIHLTDLPGAYSLSPQTPEEIIARTALLDTAPDLIVNVLDAGQLERNLYLTLQLMEFGLPMVLALNLMDEAKSKGLNLNPSALEKELGVPVVEMVASQGKGVQELKQHMLQPPLAPKYQVQTPASLQNQIQQLCEAMAPHPKLLPYSRPFLASMLLEGDTTLRSRLTITGHQKVVQEADRLLEQCTAQGMDPFMDLADVRYAEAHRIAQATIVTHEKRRTLTEVLDGVLLNRALGIPVFLLLMLGVFRLTFSVAQPFVDFIGGPLQDTVSGWTTAILNVLHAPSTISSVLVGAVIPGVGTVLAFLPTLLVLYLAMSFLEDSGYMARAAFLMDRLMRSVGLDGKAFIPMILGFGCNVPAVYATRTLENPRARLVTSMILPFMSCSARLPVYAVFSAALFPKMASWVVWSMYVLGLVVALAFAAFITRLLPTAGSVTVLELPPYRLPSRQVLWKQGSRRTASFVKRAGTTVLTAVVVVWFTLSIPVQLGEHFASVAPEQSLFGWVSSLIAPIFSWAGFDTWQATGALIPGFVAKEVVIGTLGQIYLGQQAGTALSFGLLDGLQNLFSGLWIALQQAVAAIPGLIALPSFSVAAPDSSQNNLIAALRQGFTPAAGLAYLVFVLLYTPCVATITAIANEQGRKVAWITVAYQILTAWLLAVLTYQLFKGLL